MGEDGRCNACNGLERDRVVCAMPRWSERGMRKLGAVYPERGCWLGYASMNQAGR